MRLWLALFLGRRALGTRALGGLLLGVSSGHEPARATAPGAGDLMGLSTKA